ncbi:MAG: GNAT family N-acetyltransferase [Anaeroplasmataceae bacterium]|nr:GNAT family N-acetyltransferase [Anaeroplasmataceae bacterium]
MKNIVSIEEYLKNPCQASSIPYWKAKVIPIPNTIVILHQNEFHEQYDNYQRYFRLLHTLNDLKPILDDTETIGRTEELLDLLNVCFEKENIELSLEDLCSMQSHPTFHKSLWVGIRAEAKLIACGIGEFDKECREGILEWICVLPQAQREGYGSTIVSVLLHRLKKLGALFVTVSGRVDNISNPEKFYRSCGFKGTDIWYICNKKET